MICDGWATCKRAASANLPHWEPPIFKVTSRPTRGHQTRLSFVVSTGVQHGRRAIWLNSTACCRLVTPRLPEGSLLIQRSTHNLPVLTLASGHTATMANKKSQQEMVQVGVCLLLF